MSMKGASTIFRIVCLAAPLLIATRIRAQEPKEVSDGFCKCLVKHETNCVDQLYASFKWMAQDSEAKAKLAEQFNTLRNSKDIIGDLEAYELLRDKNLGNTFRGLVYVLKYGRQPYRITLVFYKASERWSLFDFKLDEQLDVDFGKSLQE